MIDSYTNLPGQLVQFKDGGLQIKSDPNPPSTKSVLILGTASDGPICEPVAVDSGTAEPLFGKVTFANGVPNGATLMQGFEEAWNAGCRDIRLMRISGEVAKGSIEAVTTVNTVVKNKMEVLGRAIGNAEKNITLSKYPVVENTVQVFGNSVEITGSKFSVNESTGVVTLLVNATDSGANINIKYSWYTETPVAVGAVVPEEMVKGLDNKTFSSVNGFANWVDDVGSPVVVYVDGVVTTTGFTINFEDGKVVFTNVQTKPVTVSYTYNARTVTSASENGSSGGGGFVPWRAAGSPQVLALDLLINESPQAARAVMYANTLELATDAFIIDTDDKTAVLKSGYAPMGAIIELAYNYEQVTNVVPKITLESNYGGNIYNGLKFKVDNELNNTGNIIGKKITITKPDSKKAQIAEASLVYRTLDYPTFGLLVQAMNGDTNNGIFRAFTTNDAIASDTIEVCAETNFDGGDDGIRLTKQRIYELLGGTSTTTGIYQILENYNVDMIVPMGVCADDELIGRYDNFAYQLGLACAVITFRNNAVHGIIATSSPVETSLVAVQAHTEKLLALKNNFFMLDRAGNEIKDPEGGSIDVGKFLVVLAGPDVVLSSTRLGLYGSNSPAAYAGFVSTLPPQSAATNKTLGYAQGMRFKYSNPQLDKLTAARYTTFNLKNNGQSVAVVDAMTAAQSTSDYTRQSTWAAVKECVNQIRKVCDPYIGEPNEVSQRNAMSAAIDKILSKIKEAGVITDYGFQVVATLVDQVLGQSKIELTIVPALELRKIITTVSLKPSM